jgi:hypothetical protein
MSTLKLSSNWLADYEIKQGVCEKISHQIMDLYEEY